jgi:triacylglycerol lipase
MDREVRSLVRSLGVELSPAMVQGTQKFLADRFGGIDGQTKITRDLSYGPHERHRLDMFTADGRGDAPLLVFVHGGGFVMGDKRAPGLPFYDNVGDFAVRAGFVGVTLTYRLAPAFPWPAGSEDVGAALRWLREHAAEYGADPRRIFVMGQSAGAVHVAGYVAHSQLHPGDGLGIAGALLVSGVYDIARADANPFQRAYYGDDVSKWADRSTLSGLVAAAVPLFFSVSEYDPADFQRQAGFVAAAFTAAHQRFPALHWLAGHNHLSPVLAIGSTVDVLGPLIRDFIATAGN